MYITSNLIYYRLKNKFSQDDVAILLNISRQAISKWERGICLPDIENIIILAKIYNISLDELFFKKNTQKEVYKNYLIFIKKCSLS